MGYLVKMPKLGVEMQTGTVLEWFVDESDPIEEGDVIAEIESEKTVAEVAARESGVLRRILLAEGEDAAPGAPMGIVAGPEEDVSDLTSGIDVEMSDDGGAPADGEEPVEPRPASEGTDATRDGADATAGSSPSPGDGGADADVAPRTPEGQIMASPKAKQRARERGVSLATVPGSGPQGSIVASDVEAAASEGTGRTVREERPLSSMRSTIAERLGESYRDAPHVTVDREVDVEPALAAVDRASAEGEVEVGLMDVILAAVSATLADHPAFNATYDAEAEVHTLYEEHNVGVAVDVENGLVTPVLPDLRDASLREVAASRRRHVDRVLDGEYDADDLAGGTFTVSNLGAMGSDSFTPIINPPEVAILGVNRVRERPVNTDAGIEFRRHVTFSLSFDHRVVDGADAAQFLATLADHLSDART